MLHQLPRGAVFMILNLVKLTIGLMITGNMRYKNKYKSSRIKNSPTASLALPIRSLSTSTTSIGSRNDSLNLFSLLAPTGRASNCSWLRSKSNRIPLGELIRSQYVACPPPFPCNFRELSRAGKEFWKLNPLFCLTFFWHYVVTRRAGPSVFWHLVVTVGIL